MKTPSFIELKTLIEYLNEEIVGAQLQEVHTTDEGLVLSFYRYTQMPRSLFLVFDLDRPFPFLGLFEQHPWKKQKKSKPVGLFLSAHTKNLYLKKIELIENLGRVVRFHFGQNEQKNEIEFRLIPKQPNLIVKAFDQKAKVRSISWYPVLDLVENDPAFVSKNEDEARSIPFFMQQWLKRRGSGGSNEQKSMPHSSLSPYEKWKKQREKDLQKKQNALTAIQNQIDQFKSEPWSLVGEHLKAEGLKNLKPEWSPYVQFNQSVSKNMQICFEKAKAGKAKIKGALQRLQSLQTEIQNLQDLSETKFEQHLKKLAEQKNKTPARTVEGRYRKLTLNETELICYMGKSAQDNIDLLRRSKAWDYWMHLKDYSSAYAIIHRQKNQSISDQDLFKCARWLIKEGLSEKHVQMGGRFAVVVVECRHVKPIKGDKLGRVTYHEAREILIAT